MWLGDFKDGDSGKYLLLEDQNFKNESSISYLFLESCNVSTI